MCVCEFSNVHMMYMEMSGIWNMDYITEVNWIKQNTQLMYMYFDEQKTKKHKLMFIGHE